MDRNLLPSESKLERLRDEGIVPLSIFAAKTTAAAVVLVAATLLINNWHNKISTLRASLLSYSSNQETLGGFFTFQLLWMAKVVLGLAAIYLVFSMFATLFQSKFLFRMGFSAFRFNRLWQLGNISLQTFSFRMLLILLLMVASFVVGLLLFWAFSTNIFGVLNKDSVEILVWSSKFLTSIFLTSVILLICVAAIAWLVNRRLFLQRHKMTREELRQEGS